MHQRFISHREVFFASPESFEDKFDCYNPTRFDLLDKHQIYEYFIWSSKEINPHFTRQQHRSFAREWSKTSAVNDKKRTIEFMANSIKQYYQHQGILSLTENYDSDYLWQEYAKNETGFCIGYDPKILFPFLGSGGPVEYVDELPIVMPEPFMHSFIATRYRVYYKHLKWAKEEEFRATKFWPNIATESDRRMKLPKEAFVKVFIGKNMDENIKKELIDSIKENIGDIEIVER